MGSQVPQLLSSLPLLDLKKRHMYRNANSSWDHCSSGDLSRNIFSLKQKATMLRISLQHFQHIWLRTAGEAVLSTHFFILVLEVCQLLVGLQGAGEESSNLWGRRCSNSCRSDFRERNKQLSSNSHFTPKLPGKLQVTILCAYKIYARDVDLECMCTYSLHHIPVPCHIKQAVLWYCAGRTTLKTHVHPSAPQERRNIRGAPHNSAFKNTSAFLDSFYQAQRHSLLYE